MSQEVNYSQEVIKKKILIIANKSWEADPLINVFLNDKVCPEGFGQFNIKNHPFPEERKRKDYPNNPIPSSRIKFEYNAIIVKGNVIKKITAEVVVCCIQDLMNPALSYSNTREKIRILPKIFEEVENPDYIIAFGTAGFPDPTNYDGCAVVGTQAFIHNPYADNREFKSESDWPHDWDDYLDTLLESSLTDYPGGFFRKISSDVHYHAEGRMLRSPLNPARPPVIIHGARYVALGIVNVIDYDHYVWADQQAIDIMKSKYKNEPIGSVETTHGVIRLVAEEVYRTKPPFLFVSGITDRVKYFDMELVPRSYGQNFVASHNAGVSLAWLIPELAKF